MKNITKAVKTKRICLVIFKFLILFFVFTGDVNADEYYVAPPPEGGEKNSGTAASPFSTIQAAVDKMKPGDICYVKSGIYCEKVNFARDGKSGKPIKIQAAGNAPVIVTGAEPVKGWKKYKDRIFRAPVSGTLGPGESQLFIRGKVYHEARWPNLKAWKDLNCSERLDDRPKRCCDIEDFSTSWYGRTFNDPGIMAPCVVNGWCENLKGSAHRGIPDTENEVLVSLRAYGEEISGPEENEFNIIYGKPQNHWKGAIVWQKGWWFSTSGVVTQSYDGVHTQGNGKQFKATFFRFGSDRARWPKKFAVIGHYDLIDKPGEWAIKDNYLYLMMPEGVEPEKGEIMLKKRQLAFNMKKRNYIHLSGLHVMGASVQMDSASYCTFDDCHFYCLTQYWVHQWKDGGALGPGDKKEVAKGTRGILLNGTGNVFDKCSFYYSAANALIISSGKHNVTNCYFYGIDYVNTYAACIYGVSDGCEITDNTFEKAGRSHLNGIKGCKLLRNKFLDAMMLSGDGGTVYTYGAVSEYEFGYNWFRGCYGEPSSYLYTDAGGKSDAIVHHNVFFHSKTEGKFVPLAAHGLRYYNNTFLGGINARDYDFRVRDSMYVDSADKRWANNLNASEGYSFWKFSDTANGDFTLQSSSPAVDSGVVIDGITDGYVGQAPDLGAYEYGKPAWNEPGHDWGEPLIEEALWEKLKGGASTVKGVFKSTPAFNMKKTGPRLVLSLEAGRRVEISIFDARGRLWRKFSPAPYTSRATIELESLPAGLFSLRASYGEKAFVRRFMVVR